MKIRITITDRTWEYRVAVRRSDNGQWFCKLVALDGSKLPHGPCLGYFPTADAAIERAPTSYLQLVAMLESNKSAAASQASHETTINHSAEFSNANP